MFILYQLLFPFVSVFLGNQIEIVLRAQSIEVVPSLTVAILFYWTVFEPDRKILVFGFFLGVFYDVALGNPLGFTSLLYVLTYALTYWGRQQNSFFFLWAIFAVLSFVIVGVKWGVMNIMVGRHTSFYPYLFESILTGVSYPLIAWLLGTLMGVRTGDEQPQ